MLLQRKREAFMSSKQQKLEHFIEEWQRQTGKSDINMHDVAQFAHDHGFRLPTSPSPIDLLAREFAHAAREKTERDEQTGRPYRVYHAFKQRQGDQQLTLWININTAPRRKMLKSLQMRREQMVGDAVAVTDDADHWNRLHTDEEGITIPLDFGPDVAERKALDEDEDGVA
jgi:hypothetical protein